MVGIIGIEFQILIFWSSIMLEKIETTFPFFFWDFILEEQIKVVYFLADSW